MNKKDTKLIEDKIRNFSNALNNANQQVEIGTVRKWKLEGAIEALQNLLADDKIKEEKET